MMRLKNFIVVSLAFVAAGQEEDQDWYTPFTPNQAFAKCGHIKSRYQDACCGQPENTPIAVHKAGTPCDVTTLLISVTLDNVTDDTIASLLERAKKKSRCNYNWTIEELSPEIASQSGTGVRWNGKTAFNLIDEAKNNIDVCGKCACRGDAVCLVDGKKYCMLRDGDKTSLDRDHCERRCTENSPNYTNWYQEDDDDEEEEEEDGPEALDPIMRINDKENAFVKIVYMRSGDLWEDIDDFADYYKAWITVATHSTATLYIHEHAFGPISKEVVEDEWDGMLNVVKLSGNEPCMLADNAATLEDNLGIY